MNALRPLPPREAYALWASAYDEENALSSLEDHAARALTPPLANLRLLDAGCGTARRLVFAREAAPRRACGVDLVLPMLARARAHPERSRLLAAADARRLPLVSSLFDVVWLRLVAGHLPELRGVYAELARVLATGGVAVVTDLHEEAARRGHRRSFRDAAGEEHAAMHVTHGAEAHGSAARAAGFLPDGRLELSVSERVRPFYEKAGALARYEGDLGLPVVDAFRFRRT